MLSKNTIIDLWWMLTDIPTVMNAEMATVIDEDFIGWPSGTDVEKIWHWFDEQYADFGGVHALMYDNPQPERSFRFGLLMAFMSAMQNMNRTPARTILESTLT